jgi:hypothetical protein
VAHYKLFFKTNGRLAHRPVKQFLQAAHIRGLFLLV